MNGAPPQWLHQAKPCRECDVEVQDVCLGLSLSARRFDNQRVEAIIKCAVLNRMSSRGMPESVRIR